MALSIPSADPDPVLLFSSHPVGARDGWSSWMLGNYNWELGSPRRYDSPAALLLLGCLVCLNSSSIIDCWVNRSWCKYKKQQGTIASAGAWSENLVDLRWKMKYLNLIFVIYGQRTLTLEASKSKTESKTKISPVPQRLQSVLGLRHCCHWTPPIITHL